MEARPKHIGMRSNKQCGGSTIERVTVKANSEALSKHLSQKAYLVLQFAHGLERLPTLMRRRAISNRKCGLELGTLYYQANCTTHTPRGEVCRRNEGRMRPSMQWGPLFQELLPLTQAASGLKDKFRQRASPFDPTKILAPRRADRPSSSPAVELVLDLTLPCQLMPDKSFDPFRLDRRRTVHILFPATLQRRRYVC